MEIENPWCVYGAMQKKFIGKVTQEFDSSVIITPREEGSHADFDAWDRTCVKQFKTLSEAVQYLCENLPVYNVRDHQPNKEDIESMARAQFPSEYESK